MKIGYPCINRSIGCTANSTFRLANYSEHRLIEKVGNNLDCLQKILEFNVENNFLFFRISSDIVPFASHPVCTFDWIDHFKKDFVSIGSYIKKNNIRISMHPDQFILINAKDENIVKRSIAELDYHCNFLDAMKLDKAAKVQVHVGGVYGDKDASIERFIKNYNLLPQHIKKRLVIENDHNRFNLSDCLQISSRTKIPIVFDSFHHECFNNGETMKEAAILASKTWKKSDGVLMVDYSSQQGGKVKGAHAQSINMGHFKQFLQEIAGLDCDIMLEIKDKEASALRVHKYISRLETI